MRTWRRLNFGCTEHVPKTTNLKVHVQLIAVARDVHGVYILKCVL